MSGLFGTFQDFIQSFAVLQCGDAGNDCRLSLASRLGNVLILSLQSKGLKTKNLLKQAWQIFLFLILMSIRSLYRGDAGNRTRVQTSNRKAFYMRSF